MRADNTELVAESDLAIMHVLHDALRRDLRRLDVAAARLPSNDPTELVAVRARWAMFCRQLTYHHGIEDSQLWPRIRQRLSADPAAITALDVVEAEHARIDSAIAAVDTALADEDGGHRGLAHALDALRTLLAGHLAHEERAVLPLIATVITRPEWRRIGRLTQREIGFRGSARFFPWLLDDADPDHARLVVRLLPAPLRWLNDRVWTPSYFRASRWPGTPHDRRADSTA